MTVADSPMTQEQTKAVAKVIHVLRGVPESERADVLAMASHVWIHTDGTLNFDNYKARR